MNNDMERLFGKPNPNKESTDRKCIWRISYEATGKVPDVPEMGTDAVNMSDYVDVLSGSDCREAITKAEGYINDPESFPMEVERLLITGCKKLAEAEI